MIKKLAKKEIKFAHGLGIIIVLSIALSAIVGVKTINTINYVKAFSLWQFGGRIAQVTPCICTEKCNTCSIDCDYTPPVCPCAKNYPPYTEVDIIPAGGGKEYVCVPTGFKPYGPGLQPGNQILGWGWSDQNPVQIGTSF